MKHIENYKLNEFIQLPPEKVREYIVVLSHVLPIETNRHIINLKLKHVELIKKSLYNGTNTQIIKIVSKVQKVKESEVLEMPIIDFYRIIRTVKDQLKMVIKAEQNSLKSNHINRKWELVNGSERMAEFGILNTLESLSGGDALKYNKYLNMRYSMVFAILRMRKTADDIRQDMEQIKD